MASSTVTNSKYLDYAGLSHLKTVLDGRYANKAIPLPYFTISSNSTLPTDGSAEYVKFARITIPTSSWSRSSATLFFQDYEATAYQGDILTIQATSDGSGVGITPSVKWVTKNYESTIGSVIISKISNNVYDLYLEIKNYSYVTLHIFYLTEKTTGTDGVFNFINASSWSTAVPTITARSSLINISSKSLYSASSGYAATAGRSIYSASSGYAATAGRSIYSASSGLTSKVTIEAGSSDVWRNMLVTAGENDIFSVPNVFANYTQGALKAKSVYISGSANNTTGFISSDTTNNMYFSISGVIPLVINTESTTNPCIRSSNSLKDKVDLGLSTNKWRNVYATTFNGNLTGNVTGSATKLGSTTISFTPAETALTPDNVYTLIGGTTIKRGSWSYAGNGYISNDTTGVGTIDLAGTTVIQADGGSSTAYTQLYLTPATGSTTGCKTNEIFMYNNNGSGYSPSWTRILTNRNYTDYCATVSHAHSYVASAGYSATSGRSTYSSSAGVAQYSGSAGYSATAGRSTYSGSAGFTQYSSSAGYSATAGRSIYSSTSGYAATAYNISSANLVTNETINTLTDDTVPVVPNIATTQIVNSGALRQFWVNVRNIIEDNEFVCASALTDLNTRLDNINASISLAAPVSTTKYNILGSPSTTGELNTAYCNSSVYMQGNNLYATSDARLKDFKEDIEVDLEKLRKLPKKYFTWKGESMMDIGTSAQELLKLYPELVSYDSVNDIYAVDYVKLSVIALAAVDTLYDRLKSTEDRLKVIEDKLAKLS